MVKFIPIALLFVLSTFLYSESKNPIAIAIHGGAGTILKKNITSEQEKKYRAKLQHALEEGYKVLQNGGKSLDAIEKAITILENSPLFNAGKGAVFTNTGTNELDASIMDGKTLQAGAVASVKRIKNPIQLARLVMEKSPHVLMCTEGAEIFAQKQGMKFVTQKYFYTERRWQQLQKRNKASKFGTVGAVALDASGNLAAGTSTGGLTNKKYGRIGDSPIIGAGTYANNKTCAISATGHGEYFIRSVVAYDISALIEYKEMPLQAAADRVIQDKLVRLGGKGGIIGINTKGDVAVSFNTQGMYRGYIDSQGNINIHIYK